MDGFSVSSPALQLASATAGDSSAAVSAAAPAEPVAALEAALPGGVTAVAAVNLALRWAAASTGVADAWNRQASNLAAAAVDYGEADAVVADRLAQLGAAAD